jgi:hypothetical protein
MRLVGRGYDLHMSEQSEHEAQQRQPDGEVSEVSRLDPADAGTPTSDGDATAGYPTSESGEVQEPSPEAGPNANPHRDENTH